MSEQQQIIEFDVNAGTSAREAVLLSEQYGLITVGTGIDIATVPLGVYGEIVDDDYPLSANERVELYRPLQQDPKELRRQRAKKPVSR